MTIPVTAFLADSVQNVNGKLYGLGIGWDLISTPVAPCVLPQVALGILVHIGWGDLEVEHNLRVHLETEDGVAVPFSAGRENAPRQRPTFEWSVAFMPERSAVLVPGAETLMPFALNVNALTLPRAGGYSWVITVDYEETARLPLRVVIPEFAE